MVAATVRFHLQTLNFELPDVFVREKKNQNDFALWDN